MQTLTKINLRQILSIGLALAIMLVVLRSCVEEDPQQGMPGHMVQGIHLVR